MPQPFLDLTTRHNVVHPIVKQNRLMVDAQTQTQSTSHPALSLNHSSGTRDADERNAQCAMTEASGVVGGAFLEESADVAVPPLASNVDSRQGLGAFSPNFSVADEPCSRERSPSSTSPLDVHQSSSGAEASTKPTSASMLQSTSPKPILLSNNTNTAKLPSVAKPLWQSRPFAKGPGHTSWYYSIESCAVDCPRENLGAKLGDLYVHVNSTTRELRSWMWNALGWVVAEEGDPHPLYPDRVLHMRASGDPSWVSPTTLATYGSRAKKEVRHLLVGVFQS
ncbi:hypothetical protein BV25DRAFT_1921573 [Artomyces pyxidatus]|uniref:Uncharacterized protein n=1 Tax=Artomyces pyxidatus TaxID=48021 RepID=A0ACB8SH01_9AGAM|nr:hypothetical protein BV25DRAFT_1921573 [Artomyces pyxidatus]